MKWWGWWRKTSPKPEWEDEWVPLTLSITMGALARDRINRPYLGPIMRMYEAYGRGDKSKGDRIFNSIPMWMLIRFLGSLKAVQDLSRPGSEVLENLEPLEEKLRARRSSVPHAEPEVMHVPARGARAGRPPKLSLEKQAEALRMRAEGVNNADIARSLGVSRSTISRL